MNSYGLSMTRYGLLKGILTGKFLSKDAGDSAK